MSLATERLRKFLSLVDQGPAQRAALAEELADFLAHWPQDCPEKMRAPVSALFDMTLSEADSALLRRLAGMLVPLPPLPIESYARIFALAPPQTQRQILDACQRGPVNNPPMVIFKPDQLITAARVGVGDFAPELAAWMQIPPRLSVQILADESAMSLAVLCKGTLLGRARFSALSLILFQDLPLSAARLGIYDDIPQSAAMRLTGIWQAWRGSLSHAA